MKKSIFLLAAAAAAFASCTQNEVMEVAENRTIKFSSFVSNNTRATEIAKGNLTQFNVFGSHGSATTWAADYTNESVTGSITNPDNNGEEPESQSWTPATTAYWQAGNAYEFAAYSNGNTALPNENVTFSPATKTLSISGYTVEDKDLIAALQTVGSQSTVSDYPTVGFTFYHMLSQIQFTFTNTDSRDYKMEISDLTINAKKTNASATFTASGTVWTDGAAADYTVSGIEDIADGNTTDKHETESIFILPQVNDALIVSFTATCTDGQGTEIAKGDFTASLDTDGSSSSAWQPGYRYNYTAEINASTIDPNLEQQIIEFTVTKIEDWKDNKPDTTLDPQTQP